MKILRFFFPQWLAIFALLPVTTVRAQQETRPAASDGVTVVTGALLIDGTGRAAGRKLLPDL